jgi:FtsH-binding integral membrane protein
MRNKKMVNILIGVIGTIIASRYISIDKEHLKEDISSIKKRILSEKSEKFEIETEIEDNLE